MPQGSYTIQFINKYMVPSHKRFTYGLIVVIENQHKEEK